MRAALFCSALAFAAVVGGCSKPCPNGTTMCLGVCTDLTTDSLNCGTCGTACVTGQACSNGTCVVTCPTGSTACGDLCVNTNTDQANCGACGQKCASGQVCAAGTCATSCLAGDTVCGGTTDAGEDAGPLTCANLPTDSANCGSCGFPCPAGTVCNGNGTCAADCATGFNGCTTTATQSIYCANFKNDNGNCGSCGAPCPSGEVCSAGKCATTCAAGYNACGGVDGGIGICANFLTDPLNCGACGHPCSGGTACSGGQCTETCASGFNACQDGGGYCANFLTDSVNCGTCGKACGDGQSCQGGTCAETCAAGFSVCGASGSSPYCANLETDSDNCGTCGKACGAGQVCNGSGVCAESCAAGYSPCVPDGGQSPYCANVNADRNNCGTCGTVCGNGKVCSAGNCLESCASGYIACSNKYCADIKTDADNCGACGKSCAASFDAPGCCNGTCTSLATGDTNNCGTCGTVCSGTEPGCCEGGCVDEATDTKNCGSCGNVCGTGISPTCCTSGKTSVCVDDWTDPSNCGACGTVCASGICAGACCNAACDSDSTTNCAGTCDSSGDCTHPTCNAGYGCDSSTTCKTSCDSDADCAPVGGYACRGAPGGICCVPLTTGGTLYVDGKLGSDSNCCDSASSPCLTITGAMKLVTAGKFTGVTIKVAWNATPTTRADWNPSTAETYPIHLGYGVTLYAPGIFFQPPTPKAGQTAGDVLNVYSYGGTDTGTVTIEGDPAVDFVLIGIDSKQASLTNTAIAVNAGVASKTAVPLVLNDVWMNGQTEALNLGAGANVSLGPSPVIIGSGASTASALSKVESPGLGIYCQGTAASPATLTDVDAGGSSVLEIDQQDSSHATKGTFYAYDECNVTLSQSPIFGLPPPCPSPKVDGEGLLLGGASTVSLTGATVECMFNHGIDIGEVTTLGNNPTVTLSKSVIQHTGQTGLKVNGGAVTATNTSIHHCRFGTVLQLTATLDLSGGGNILSCNTENEPGGYGGTVPGIDAWNQSAAGSINAANVGWDANPPAYWTCTDQAGGNTATTCTCASGPCNGINVATPDNSEAVTCSNTNVNPIVLTNSKLQSKFTCP